MNIKVLFDNYSKDKDFLIGWGVSCLIDEHILFDTGEDFEKLFHNMKKMDVSIKDITKIIISHEHWDHTGGLWGILEKRKELTKVYICSNSSKDFKNEILKYNVELIDINGDLKIEDDIYTTGQIICKYKGSDLFEQALILKTDKGVSVITGCAHPGIIKIVNYAQKNFKEPINFIVGGFHLKDFNDKELDNVMEQLNKIKFNKIVPIHCTGRKAVETIKQNYSDKFMQIKCGMDFEV
jgi:7,8-dihydropterin-6-yl-methyl-4-(beta-D-ribofuranosyl)aminobenzene 5'-phosphate synthase